MGIKVGLVVLSGLCHKDLVVGLNSGVIGWPASGI